MSQTGLKCTGLIVKQHVVMETANGESDKEKERRRRKGMREMLQVKNYIAEKLNKSSASAPLHWS